jgi:hypothetical protein
MLSHLSKRSARQYYRDSMLHLEIGVNFNKLLMDSMTTIKRTILFSPFFALIVGADLNLTQAAGIR